MQRCDSNQRKTKKTNGNGCSALEVSTLQWFSGSQPDSTLLVVVAVLPVDPSLGEVNPKTVKHLPKGSAP